MHMSHHHISHDLACVKRALLLDVSARVLGALCVSSSCVSLLLADARLLGVCVCVRACVRAHA